MDNNQAFSGKIIKKISLKTFEDVKRFVAFSMSKSYDIELVSGKYVINAKSIMGVFSLDLTQPITMIANTENDEELDGQIKPFETPVETAQAL